jgi:hypothetical protein
MEAETRRRPCTQEESRLGGPALLVSRLAGVAQPAGGYFLTRLIDVVSGTNSTPLIAVSKV